MTTVVNESVRAGLECDLNILEVDGMKRVMRAIERDIEQSLMPRSSTIELVPYKLNVYGPGGFFKPHVDTPTDTEKMVGTVVVCWPSKFSGGVCMCVCLCVCRVSG